MASSSSPVEASLDKSADKPNKKKIFKFTGEQSYVKIHTGTGRDKDTFAVLKNLLCFYSPFFEAAFESEFIEGQTQEMTLEDVESEIFGLLVAWVSTQKIWNGESVEIPAVDLAKLWVLADRFLMPRLQNPVMKKLGDPDSWWSHNPKVLNPPEDSSITAHKELIAYVNSTEGRDTPLKRYCTRLLLSRIEGSFEDEDMNPPDYQAQCKSEVHSVTGTG